MVFRQEAIVPFTSLEDAQKKMEYKNAKQSPILSALKGEISSVKLQAKTYLDGITSTATITLAHG